MSRIRALFKKTGTDRATIDLNETLREVIDLVRSDVHRHGASIEIELADELPPVNADRVQLQQVLVNLVVNAAEAMASVEQGTRSITVRTRRDAERFHVEVADTGPGIPTDQSQKVFEPFHTTKAKGMGIGLAVSRTIIEDHGGQLGVGPNPDAGTGACFYFTLPVGATGAVVQTD